MKYRLYLGIIFIVLASVAMVLFLRTDRRESGKGMPMAAHGSSSRPEDAVGMHPGSQDEKQMLVMALKKNPEHIPVLIKLAQIEAEEGHLQEAAGHLQKILEKDTGNPEANLELGKVLFRQGDVHGAIEHTEKILQDSPAYEDALYNLGAIYANTGNREQAMKYWNRLTALHSNSEGAKMASQMMSRLARKNP
jgi:Flp pilus assembly protein TadD